MEKLLMIALGGGLGSVLRYLLAGWVQGARQQDSVSFPVGTLAVNTIGSLMIGVLAALFISGPYLMREEYRVAVLIGLLGGFTTFSTFSYETLELLNDSQWARAGMNILLTNALCLAAVWIGYRLADYWVGA